MIERCDFLIQDYMKIQNKNEKLYFSVVNIARSWTHVRSWFQVSKVSWHKDSAEPTRTEANDVFVTLSLAKRLTCDGTSLASRYCGNVNKQCAMEPERKNIIEISPVSQSSFFPSGEHPNNVY